MPKLRHIALHTPDPEQTAEFYKRVFEMQEVGRTDSPLGPASHTVVYGG